MLNYRILFLGLLFLTACGDRNCDRTLGYYDFDAPISLTPALDSFSIGDTIHISSVFSKNVFERKSMDSFYLDDFLFFPISTIYRIDTSLYDPGGFNDFEVIVPNEYNYNLLNYSDGGVDYLGQYLELENEYSLEFKLIPQSSGSYVFLQGSDLLDVNLEQNFPGKCKGFGMDLNFVMNQGEDNNVDFLLESPDPVILNLWNKKDEKFHHFGGYCFYVVE